MIFYNYPAHINHNGNNNSICFAIMTYPMKHEINSVRKGCRGLEVTGP